MSNLLRAVNFQKDITLRSWKSPDGKVGLEMTLMRDVHFAGYEPGDVIRIYGLDFHQDGSADCVASEHYKPEDLIRAMEAFEERLDENEFFSSSSKTYASFQELNHILKKKVKVS